MKRIWLILLALPACAQFSTTAKHIIYTPTLPATCQPGTGDVHWKTNSVGGSLGPYWCSAVNTWTYWGTAGSGSPGGIANAVQVNNGVGGFGGLGIVNNAVLVTNGTGVPSESTTLPTGLAMQTPASINLTNGAALPIGTGVSGLGTGVATALGVNVGTPGAFVVNGGALGTPSGGILTNATGLPIGTGVSGLGANVATFLGTPSSANLASALTDETGTGAAVFANTPSLITPRVTVINDANGNPFIQSTATASAVDSVTVTNAATANPATVTVAVTGSDANINLNLVSKGTGTVQCNGSTCAGGGGSLAWQIAGSTFSTNPTTVNFATGFLGTNPGGVATLNPDPGLLLFNGADQKNVCKFVDSTNGTTSYTGSLATGCTALTSGNLVAGSTFLLRTNFTCSAACSLQIDGQPAVAAAVKLANGTSDPAGAIIAGEFNWVMYDGTVFRLLPGGTGTAFNPQTNGVNNTSQAGLNFITSTTNSDGLTVTPSNPATSQEKMEITGNYSGVLASGVTGTTQTANDNSTKIATTAYVDTKVMDPFGTPGAGFAVDWDDFINSTANIGGSSYYKLRWTPSTTSGGTITDLNGIAGHPGIADFDTSTTSGGLAILTLRGNNQPFVLATTTNWEFQWIVAVPTSLTNENVAVGFFQDLNGFRAGANAPLITATFAPAANPWNIPTDATHWQLCLGNTGSGFPVCASTGVVVATTSWYRIRMFSTSIGVVNLQISTDGGAYSAAVTGGTGQTVNVALPTGALNPIEYIDNNATTNDNHLSVDKFAYRLTGLN